MKSLRRTAGRGRPAHLALAAVLSVNAVALKLKFTDDLMKDLAADMEKDMSTESLAQEEPAAAAPAPAKVEKKTEAKAAKTDKKEAPAKGKKTDAKAAAAPAKEEKAEKQEDDIPFDASAMKAYSSVIADAAEDSEPSEAVVYTKTIPDEEAHHDTKAPLEFDPMGSMIQNEISEIKDASIKAAKDKDE